MSNKTLTLIGISIFTPLAVMLAFFLMPMAAHSDFTQQEPVTDEFVALDNRTGLMWEVKTPGNAGDTYNWEQALGYCEGLSHAGHPDWRLPTVKELASIRDLLKTVGPRIDTGIFPHTQTTAYWSSTTRASSPASAWLVSFNSGSVSSLSKTDSHYVRCVR